MGTPVLRGVFKTRSGQYSLHRRPDIFISHTSADKPFVRRLAGGLNNVGVDAWLDEWELAPGDSLRQALGAALEKSRFVGIVISPRFLKSEWCMNELDQAMAHETRKKTKVIIPLLHKATIAPSFIERRLYIDFSKNFFVGLGELSRIVHGLDLGSFRKAVVAKKPRGLGDVGRILQECGWEHQSLFERRDIEQLKKRLDDLRIGYEEEGCSVLVEDEDLLMNREEISDLKVARIMLEFISKKMRGKRKVSK